MTITVGVNSYVSLEDANSYLEEYGLDTVTEVAIKQATLAIERKYGHRFSGEPTSPTQALAFPRNGQSTVPAVLQQATAELASMIANDKFDPYTLADNALSKTMFEIAGVIKESTEYNNAQMRDPLQKINLILRPLLGPSGSMYVELVRG